MHIKPTLFIMALLASLAISSFAQETTVTVSPEVGKSIKGHSTLQRSKYFNLAGSSIEANKYVTGERRTRFFEELEMTLGRRLHLVSAEVKWGNGFREDANRNGYMDTAYFKSKKTPDDNGLGYFINLWGENAGVAGHDGHNAYPSFMDKYTFSDADGQEMPTNNDASAEAAAYLFKYAYSDFQRPHYFELVNEPHWRFWGDQRFFDHHVFTKRKFHEMNIPTEVGGPCYSVGNFYKREFGNISSIKKFIDGTHGELDFYSFHIYDYMKWSDEENDFIGSVSSGLPEEAVFDALASYTYTKYGKEFTFVGSEHGGYISDQSNRDYALNKLGNAYFPGSGFAHEMEKRSINSFIMVNSAITNTMMFMNHPHIVKKTVPFILIQSANWDPTYYSSLLVKENFDKNSNTWHEAKLIYFYDFFKDIRGIRVKSYCPNADLQHHAFVDGNTLSLLFHNQSDVEQHINLAIDTLEQSIKKMTIRRVGRTDDFRPYLTEEDLASVNGISIHGQESVVVFVEYNAKVTQNNMVDEIPFYSVQKSSQFTGSKTFNVLIPEFERAQYGILRVGIGRTSTAGKEVEISLNGTKLNIPVEDAAPRLSSSSDYATTRFIKVDGSMLKANNAVTVKFPDGKSGGVGAVVIRAAFEHIDSLKGISIVDSLNVYAGQEKYLDVTYIPHTANNKTVSWLSLDEAIATVNEGVVKGIAAGSTKVIVSSEEGGFKDTCTVTVKGYAYKSHAPKPGIKAIYADDEGFQRGMLKELAVDGNKDTYWHTEWIPNHNPLPHQIWVDLGDTLPFNEFIMTPRQDEWGPNGTIGAYELYVSNDTANWGQAIVKDEWKWNTDGGDKYYYKEVKHVNFDEVTGRYVRLLALTEHQNRADVTTSCVAEMDFTAPATGVVTEKHIDILADAEQALSARLLPLGGLHPNNDFKWTSLNPEIAVVNNGTVTGISEGETEVVVAAFGGEFSDTCTVMVTEPRYSILALVSDKNSTPISGATIYINNENYMTSATGTVTIADIKRGNYTYSVIADGYRSAEGRIDLTTHSKLNVALELAESTDKLLAPSVWLYPNPAQNKLNIIGLSTRSTYHMVNMLGAQVMSGQLAPSESIDISKLKSGMYILQMDADGRIQSQKFNKK